MSRASKKENLPAAPVYSPLNRINIALLALLHVLAALLFFTNLTRNPYYTQIALLNAGIAVIGLIWAVDVWMKGELRVPRFPYEIPLAAFIAVGLVSSLWSWIAHPMLRQGILFETTRVWVFTLVNGAMALYLPGLFTKPVGAQPVKISIWTDILLSMVWAFLWLGFHANKSPDPTALIWDSYGGLVWAMGILYTVLRTRRGEAIEFFHVIFAVSMLAGLYGFMQYMGKDIIWSSLVVPYGGRPVSSFGNPNFLSSYLMLVSPVAFAFALKSQKAERIGYGLIAFICAVSVLCTLTRSSYIGLLVAYGVMALLLSPLDPKVIFKWGASGAAVFAALIFLFPKTPITSTQSPLLRFTEVFDAIKSGQAYGPWHQRVLIWSSAWDMLKDNHLLGKGWGCFELFYPFFQGKYLYQPVLAQFRTHANNAHNILMELMSQTGFLGTGMSIWLLVTMAAGGWIIVKRESEGTGRFVAAALLAGVVGMVADNFFGNVSIFFATPAFMFWWMAGSLTNESRLKTVYTRPLTALSRTLLVLFAFFCVSVTVYFYCRWQQELYYFQGFKQAKMDDVLRSVKSLETAYQWFPGEVNNNYELGNSYARYSRMLSDKGLTEEGKKYEMKAIDGYRWALKANPGYDEIYFNLGVSQAAAGLKEEGSRNLEISLFINPILKEAYGALGNLYLQMSKPADAVTIYSRAVEAFPKDKDFWNNLGYCYSQVKDTRKSFEAYKKAVMIDPAFTQAWQNLGTASNALGEHKDPILMVPTYIRDMEAAVAQKNYKAAIGPARRVAEILPESPDAHLSVGNLLFYLNRFGEAEAAFKRAIELRPSFGIAYVNLGRLYQVNNKFDLARAHFNKALEQNPNDPEAKQALASLPK